MKASGSIYGIERYSFDSTTCRAARHAGKVGDAGGVVTVHVADGCTRFEGAERNGVASNPWSSPVSPTFAFAAAAPACVAAPVVAAKPAPVATPAAPAGPPPGSPMAAWQKRAEAYGAALPDARAGWTAAKPETEVSDSAMSGRVVSGFRQYRLGKHTANLDSIMIAVANNPDGTARYPIELWNDEAKRTAKGFTRKQVGGRDAMEGKSGAITELWFLLPNNLFVSVSWQEPHVPRDQVDAYVKAIDFAKIGALASK